MLILGLVYYQTLFKGNVSDSNVQVELFNEKSFVLIDKIVEPRENKHIYVITIVIVKDEL